MSETSLEIAVVAAYRFVEIDDPEGLCLRLHDAAERAALKGTLLITAPGAPHWEAECFVFDARETLDPSLQEAGT